MATVNDISTISLANANWIDALLNEGPSWNFLTNDGYSFRTTIYYSFSTTSGTESGITATAFNTTQIAATRQILDYVTELTGITFAETTAGYAADIHFAQANLSPYGTYTAGLCSTTASYGSSGSFLTSYTSDAHIYLDNRPYVYFYRTNQQPVAGTAGYEVLLHEIGHALGLKHPFEAVSGNTATLPAAEDNTLNTLMSYTDYPANYSYSSYSPYDIAALNWLYGTDGLGGDWGIGTDGYYYTGTNSNETFSSPWTSAIGYNLAYTGGAGTDTVVVQVAKSSLSYSYVDGWLVFTGSGSNKLHINTDIETIQFTEGSWSTISLIESREQAVTTITGTDASDYLTGTTGSDSIMGYAGNDSMAGGAGNDTLDGGTGIDTAIYNESRSALTITWITTDEYTVTGLTSGSDSLKEIELLRCTDAMVTFETSGNAGKVYRLYQAAFDRIPDLTGLGFWIYTVDNGASLITDTAAGFINSPEFTSLYGAAPSDSSFISLLYTNVLHRTLDQSGYDFWVGRLVAGASRPEVLYGFSESTENQSNVASLIANGITYQEWLG